MLMNKLLFPLLMLSAGSMPSALADEPTSELCSTISGRLADYEQNKDLETFAFLSSVSRSGKSAECAASKIFVSRYLSHPPIRKFVLPRQTPTGGSLKAHEKPKVVELRELDTDVGSSLRKDQIILMYEDPRVTSANALARIQALEDKVASMAEAPE
ncbi:hypothetical protein [Hyphomonas sp.]|uniref:hypothetical protein n=1 Tax=Hyphomonas sp. TaxID=87 RepID=UPI00324217D1